MDLRMVERVREDPVARKGFFDLAQEVFGLSFAPWYEGGYWTDRYIPYLLMDGERAAACAAVNLISTRLEGVPRRYVQIGTVMTRREFRGRGLARRLLEKILHDWRDRCHGVYLHANDRVLDFYPRFGFVPEREYQRMGTIQPRPGKVRKLDLSHPGDLALLHRCYREAPNPFSALPMRDNLGLLMFYCGGPLKHCAYYLEDLNAVVLLDHAGPEMICYDVFGGQGSALGAVLEVAAPVGVETVRLGFTPLDETGWRTEPYVEEDTTLFVLEGKENPFAGRKVMMPLLSHA